MEIRNRKAFADMQKAKYPAGTRVNLVHMADDPNPIPDGTKGTVEYVDDSGQVHIRWDCGRSLAASEEYGDVIKTITELYLVNVRFYWDGARGGFTIMTDKEVREFKTALDYCIKNNIVVEVSTMDMDDAEVEANESLFTFQKVTEEQAECVRKLLPFTEYIDEVKTAIFEAYEDRNNP